MSEAGATPRLRQFLRVLASLAYALVRPWPLQPMVAAPLLFLFAIWTSISYIVTSAVDLPPPRPWEAAASVFLPTLMVLAVYAAMWRLYGGLRTPSWLAYYGAVFAAVALATAAFLLPLQASLASLSDVRGAWANASSPVATFVRLLVFLLILNAAFGWTGRRLQGQADRAEQAVAQLREQERQFVESEERARRIAAEFLHDRVQADLLVVAIELRKTADDAPEDLARRINSITEVVETMRRSDVRDTSRRLSPMVQATGLAAALQTLAERWSPAMQVTVSLAGDAVPAESAAEKADVALGIYRIVEQALLNAGAHGHAQQVQVSIDVVTRGGSDWIRVLIRDDGRGFDPATASSGGGFATSQVWARLMGGEWSVTSRPGEGASVTAWIPR